jgi:hypothetical protein
MVQDLQVGIRESTPSSSLICDVLGLTYHPSLIASGSTSNSNYSLQLRQIVGAQRKIKVFCFSVSLNSGLRVWTTVSRCITHVQLNSQLLF